MKSSISTRNIRLYYIINFFDALIFTLPIIYVYLQGIITPVQISFILGWRYFVQFVSELPTGAIADILGKKFSVIIGCICFMLCYLLLPYGRNFWEIIAIYTLSGLGNSFNSGAFEALLYDSLVQDGKAEKFSHVQNIHNIWYQAGLILSTFMGGILFSLNLSYPFFATSFTYALAVILAIFFIEPKVDSEKFTLRNYINQIKIGVKELTKNSIIKNLSAYYILVGGLSWACVMYFNVYIFFELGFKDDLSGILQAILRLLNVLILTLFIKNNRYFSKKNGILFFPIVMILGLLPGVFLEGYFALPFIALSMLAGTARWVILGKYTNDHFESKYRATAISALSMGVGLIYMLAVVLSGPVIQYFGGVRSVYTIIGILTAFSILPLSIVIIKQHKSVEAST